MPVFAATIFLSAFLLFLVQPLIAKQILPWFGGAPSVWNTCMVFFQTLLLAGYAYADWSTRRLSPRMQAWVHVVLLALSAALLPIVADASWKPGGAEDPVWRILLLLTVTIGLPYLMLSSTGPLVQACFVRRFGGGNVYRLFALSNFGSLLALLAYPLAIETWITTRTQAFGWSAAYALYALLCAGCVIMAAGASPAAASVDEPEAPAPSLVRQALWIALAALGTVMLLAITNHMTQNISSIPLLWLAPLTLYLLSFIACFEGRGWYRRDVFVPLFVVLVPVMAWGVQTESGLLDIYKAIPLYLVGLFVACMFFHGELARSRPAPRYLTRFYLMISLGGALGGMAVGLGAPRLFTGYYELPLALLAAALIGTLALWRPARFAALAVFAAMVAAAFPTWKYFTDTSSDTVLMARNFFGVLRVQDSGEGKDRVRRLMHGTIMHGKQSFDPEVRRKPITYYEATSGLGRLFQSLQPGGPLHVGVVGLGTGTIAAYGRTGDVFRFYDINPKVVEIARSQFSYLSDSAAKVDVVLGDARLSMEREPPQGYDILVIDAFSSDSIPVHLITVQALDAYLRQMKPQGVIAFHVTNRYLDLRPVVKSIANARGLAAVSVADDGEELYGASTDWVLVTRSHAFFGRAPFQGVSEEIELPEKFSSWSDDFNNLFQVLK